MRNGGKDSQAGKRAKLRARREKRGEARQGQISITSITRMNTLFQNNRASQGPTWIQIMAPLVVWSGGNTRTCLMEFSR